ncbi:MAG: hypothetical protein ACREX6_04935, partial [Casimicrobiaceae bacterium]
DIHLGLDLAPARTSAAATLIVALILTLACAVRACDRHPARYKASFADRGATSPRHTRPVFVVMPRG